VRGMADDGHVLPPIAGPEARQVFSEDHVQHPVQPVLHPPMRPHDASEAQRAEGERAQIIVGFVFGLAVSLDRGFDPPIMARSGNTGSPG
jgi:hypothetical protein